MKDVRSQRSAISKTISLSSMLLALSFLGALLFVLSFPAEAQQSKKVPRIGYLSVLSPSSDSTRIEAFRQGLRELAYVEGQSISIESRYAEGKLNRLPDLAGELVRLKVDIIVVGGSTATRAAKNVTKLIPIVMAHGTDPVELGFVTSLARPGGNITGLTHLAPELGGKDESAAVHVWTKGVRRRWRGHVLWVRRSRHAPPRCHVCG
jgi:ABC-type uncharacterized transport system substrate-binding protein